MSGIVFRLQARYVPRQWCFAGLRSHPIWGTVVFGNAHVTKAGRTGSCGGFSGSMQIMELVLFGNVVWQSQGWEIYDLERLLSPASRH